jgi:hypothetical protein
VDAQGRLSVETVQVGDWTLVRRLGEGGMGVVHLAEDEEGNLAALKVLRPHVVGDEEARARLEREVSTLERVRSPWVAEIVDADPWGPVPFVATRYVDGPSLHDQVSTLGPLGGQTLRHFATCLAEALAAVHKAGVLHRDVKPSNVVLDGETPILIDFGLARLGDDIRLTRTGFLLGTPGYLAPEILHGHEPGPAADVHSWAATVAFAGTGRAPFGSGPPMAVMDRVRRGEHDLAGLDPSVRIVVEAALDPDPLRRPTLRALLKVLAAPPRAGVTVPVRPRGPVAEPTRVLRDASSADDGDELPLWSAAPAKPRTPIGERIRRLSVGLALLALVVVAVMAAPFVALAALAVGVAVLRWGAVTADGHRSRREARGRKWYDLPHAVVLTPIDLMVSVPATVLLWLTAALVAAMAFFACVIAGAPDNQWLAWAGGAVGVTLWLGPGSRRVRRPLGGLTRPLARTAGGWALTMLVLIGLGGAAGYALATRGTDWMPFGGIDLHADWLDLLRP